MRTNGSSGEGQERTILAAGAAELVVQRSRFLAFAEPLPSLDQAKVRQEALRRLHPGAHHVVLAARLNPGQARLSDDGEPAGTGGSPLLLLLEEEGLSRSALYVVRYFGGRKLGRQGLRAAYHAAARSALDAARVGFHVARRHVRLSVAPSSFGAFEHALRRRGLLPTRVDFGREVEVDLHLTETEWELLEELLRTASATLLPDPE